LSSANGGRERVRRAFDALERSVARSALAPAAALACAGALGAARGALSRRWPSPREVRELFGARGFGAAHRVALEIAAREAMTRLVVQRVYGLPIDPFAELVAWRDPATLERLKAPAILLNVHAGALVLFSAAFRRVRERRTVVRWSEIHRPAATERSMEIYGGLAARTAALLAARAELRAGGFVSTSLDGGIGASRPATLLGRSFAVAAAPFHLAAETGAPIVPVVALWRGVRVSAELGEPIGSPAEAAAWLERVLAREPGQISLLLLRNLLQGSGTGVPSVEPAVGAAEEQPIR
jgi:hypothetical protein